MSQNLSFQKAPRYIFSSNRQFEKGEKHITRVYNLSVLLLVRKGVLKFNEGGIPITLTKGEYYIQRPKILQEGVVESLEPNYYYIHFYGVYSEGGALPLRGRFNIDRVQSILDEFDSLSDSSEQIAKEAIFYKLLLELKNGHKNIPIPEQIRSYLLDNIEKNITIDDVSKHISLSKNQIINVFKNRYGITPHQFLIKSRLKKASELIIATDLQLKDICYTVGFSDYSNFYKSFTTEFGETPNEYREKISPKKISTNLYRFPKK